VSRDDFEVAKRIIETSGNNLHCRVAQYFVDNGWTVLISPYYIDPATDKAREVDLIVEKLFYVKDMFGRESKYFRVRLYVECKYVTQSTVFWFADMNRKEARELAATFSTLQKENFYLQEHHYLREQTRVAKLFATDNNKLTDNEWVFSAINQVLSSYNSLNIGALAFDAYRLEKRTFTYPVIVCSSFEKLFATRVDTTGSLDRITSNFLFDVHYAYLVTSARQPVDQRYYLDVVSFTMLNEFLGSLDVEMQALATAHDGDVE
jgi:hypothetical protein